MFRLCLLLLPLLVISSDRGLSQVRACRGFSSSGAAHHPHHHHHRIAQGEVVLDHTSWPFLASLRRRGAKSADNLGQICGATVLTPTTLLSAAHCLTVTLHVEDLDPFDSPILKPAEEFYVYLGELTLYPIKPASIYPIKEFIIHENYTDYQWNRIHPRLRKPYDAVNDIGLIRLARPIDFGASGRRRHRRLIDRVCLPSPEDLPDTDHCVTAGWGYANESGPSSNQLRQATLPVIACEDAMDPVTEFDPSDKLCAGIPYSLASQLHEDILGGPGMRGPGHCQADSGGPLLCPVRRAPHIRLQYGIVHGYFGECGSGRASYTRVTTFLDWILRHI